MSALFGQMGKGTKGRWETKGCELFHVVEIRKGGGGRMRGGGGDYDTPLAFLHEIVRIPNAI